MIKIERMKLSPIKMAISYDSIKRFGIFILLFLYIFNIHFSFIPYPIRTRLIIGFVGIIYFLKQKIPFVNIKIIALFLLFIFIAIFNDIINQTFDFWLIQFFIINIIYLIGACFTCEFIFKEKEFRNYNSFILLILSCILIHNIISFIGFIFPSFQNVFLSIQILDNPDLVESMISNRRRAIGLGDGNYFHGGMFSGIGMILSLYLGERSFISKSKSIAFFIIIMLTGIFIARTTLIGFIGFLLLFFTKSKIEKGKLVNIGLRILLFTAILVTFLLVFLSEYINIGWAFEMLIGYLENGNLETASSNDLKTMWIFPKTVKTFLFGDALMLYPDGTYYMHTDVGLLRHIYFWGISGFIMYALGQLYMIYCINRLSYHRYSIFSLTAVLFIYFIILNFKGFIDLNWILFLLVSFFSVRQLPKHELKYKRNYD